MLFFLILIKELSILLRNLLLNIICLDTKSTIISGTIQD
jgi:hypothetical protein